LKQAARAFDDVRPLGLISSLLQLFFSLRLNRFSSLRGHTSLRLFAHILGDQFIFINEIKVFAVL
jgi:hypothetical protein